MIPKFYKYAELCLYVNAKVLSWIETNFSFYLPYFHLTKLKIRITVYGSVRMFFIKDNKIKKYIIYQFKICIYTLNL